MEVSMVGCCTMKFLPHVFNIKIFTRIIIVNISSTKFQNFFKRNLGPNWLFNNSYNFQMKYQDHSYQEEKES